MSDELQNPALPEVGQAVAEEPVVPASVNIEAANPIEPATPTSARVSTEVSAPIEIVAPVAGPISQTPTESDKPTEINIPMQPTEASAPSPAPQVSQASPAVEMDKKFYANMGKWKEHLAQAMAKRAERKQARLNKVWALAQSQGAITNQQVKKLLRCTKLTAWRYLKTLEKQNKLHRTGSHNVPTYEVVK